MSIAEKLAQIAENEQRVYDAGFEAGKAEGVEIDESTIIEKTISGERIIYVDDVSEIPHKARVQLSSDTITDFSGIKVYVPNGNMFDKTSATDTANWSAIINNYYYFPIRVGKGITVTLSYQQGLDLGLGIYATVTLDMQSEGWGASALYHSTNTNSIHQTVTVTSQSEYIYLRTNNINNFMQYIGNQLKVEVGTKATEYGEYSATAEYEASANGVIEGINTVYPLMVVYTDENINISMSYRKSYGMQREYDAFWDVIQENGTKTDYYFAFAGRAWQNNFRPKYSMYPTNAAYMFGYWNKGSLDLVSLSEELGIEFDFSQATNVASMFASNEVVTRVGTIDTCKASNVNSVFTYCYNLHTIEKLILKDDGTTAFNADTFRNCARLVNITIEGTIGKNNLNLQWSTNLSHDSLVSIINCLQDKTADTSGTVWKVTIGSTNRAKLTEEDLNNIEAKGWVFE